MPANGTRHRCMSSNTPSMIISTKVSCSQGPPPIPCTKRSNRRQRIQHRKSCLTLINSGGCTWPEACCLLQRSSRQLYGVDGTLLGLWRDLGQPRFYPVSHGASQFFFFPGQRITLTTKERQGMGAMFQADVEYSITQRPQRRKRYG